MQQPSVTFSDRLATGKVAEGLIANWLRFVRGCTLMPVYEIEKSHGKGPQIFTPTEEIISPDIFVCSRDGLLWIEAKHKTVFSWHRLTSRWVTGIDLHHYGQYQKVQDHFGWDVWLLFLHRESTPAEKDLIHNCPRECPVGLFGQSLDHLTANENHQDLRHGKTGMVYWAHNTLKVLASLEEVYGAKREVA